MVIVEEVGTHDELLDSQLKHLAVDTEATWVLHRGERVFDD